MHTATLTHPRRRHADHQRTRWALRRAACGPVPCMLTDTVSDPGTQRHASRQTRENDLSKSVCAFTL